MRCEFGEQLGRREPVGHHYVGVGQHPATAHGDELWVAGASADERHSAVRGVGGSGRDDALLQGLAKCRSDRRGAPVLTACEYADGQALVLERCGGDSRAVAGDVGPHAEDATAIGLGDDGLVDVAIVGGGDRVPGSVEVAGAEVAQREGDSLEGFDSRGRRPGDDVDVGSIGEQQR